ncbi:hypothetical protein FQR65_LT16752 [Abscondita terminalis]|nr:hypothetical protein FQR65_LT16752 [Abscondita terminalis]
MITIILHKEGRFAKNRFRTYGCSVRIVEAEEIGRAKNLENLAKEIKTLNQQIVELQTREVEQSEKTWICEYRDVQKETFEARIEKNTIEYEEVQQSIKDTLQHVDHNDEDLLAMYAQKEALEKGLQDIEEDFYASRKVINDLEEAIAQLRKSKELTDVLIGEIKEKKTRLQIRSECSS